MGQKGLSGMDAPVQTDPEEQFGVAVVRRLGAGFWIAASWIVVMVAAAVLAPWLPIADPNETAWAVEWTAPAGATGSVLTAMDGTCSPGQSGEHGFP
jgi:hypothetical protein